METFQLGQRVVLKDRNVLPTETLVNQTFLLIGMKVQYRRGNREVHFIILMPEKTGWSLMEEVTPMERETYAVPRELYNQNVTAWWVRDLEIKHPETVKKADGCQCCKCKDFIYMAPQQSDFVCRQCVQDPYRCSSVGGDDSDG